VTRLARDRGAPRARPGVQHLAMATEPIAVTDALLDLEPSLVGSALGGGDGDLHAHLRALSRLAFQLQAPVQRRDAV
jgi:hypothetical protein